MINYMNSLLILTGILMILPFTISHAQIEPDPNQPVGPVTNIDDLNRGHSIITQLMTDHADGNFERFENQVINLAFVDPDNGTLVVGFDPIMHVLDIKPNTGDLLTGIPTDIVYAIHELLSDDQDTIQRYNSMYEHRCTNSNSLFCEKLAHELDINQFQDRPALPNTPIIFSDNFQNGLKKWNKTGDFRVKISDESSRYPPEWSSNNKVLESGKCNSNNNNTCVILLKKNLDLTKYENITLSFDYFIDHLNAGKRGFLDVYNNNRWNTLYIFNYSSNNIWDKLSFNLDNYKSSTFNLRFVVDSGKNKEVAIDNIVIKGVLDSDGDGISNMHDTCPQVFGTKSNGCPVSPPKFYHGFSGRYNYIIGDKFFYPIIVIDKEDGVIQPTCNPPNNSTIPNNQNSPLSIRCSVTDTTGDVVTKSFGLKFQHTGHQDLYGGMKHGINGLFNKGFGLDVHIIINGTITIGAETKDGTKGVVVAGHSVGYNAYKNKFPSIYHLDHFIYNNNNKHQIGFGPAVESSSFSIDAAFIPLQTKMDINPYQVKMKNGTIFTVTQSSMADTPRLAKINVYGHLTNDQGRLLFKNVTKVGGNNIYNNMGIFTSNVIPGDSGGPIIFHDNGTNKLIGSAHGATCIIHNISSQGDNTIINVSNVTFLCPTADKNDKNEDYWYYKVFTPWEHIKLDLNIK